MGTPSIQVERPELSLKKMVSRSSHGQHSPQTSIPWNHLKRKLGEYEVVPNGMLELWERVEVEWNKIGAEVCQNLIESMPRRVAAVLKAKGGYPKY
jgi:hypothetical protein